MPCVGIKSETNCTIFLIARILKVTNHLIFRAAPREGGNWTDAFLTLPDQPTNLGEYHWWLHSLTWCGISRRQTLANAITIISWCSSDLQAFACFLSLWLWTMTFLAFSNLCLPILLLLFFCDNLKTIIVFVIVWSKNPCLWFIFKTWMNCWWQFKWLRYYVNTGNRAHDFDEIKYSFIVLVEIQSRVDVVQLKVVWKFI